VLRNSTKHPFDHLQIFYQSAFNRISKGCTSLASTHRRWLKRPAPRALYEFPLSYEQDLCPWRRFLSIDCARLENAVTVYVPDEKLRLTHVGEAAAAIADSTSRVFRRGVFE